MTTRTTLTAAAATTVSATGFTYHPATDSVYRQVGESTVLGTCQVELVGSPWDISEQEWATIGTLVLA